MAAFATGLAAQAQGVPGVRLPAMEWRRVGTTTLELGLGSPAGGPVDRVWYSSNGETIFARTKSGKTWQTSDLEKWTAADAAEPPASGKLLTVSASQLLRLPKDIVYRESAVSPRNPDEFVVAADRGVWRSVDGGASWSGLNAGMPNLPTARLLSTPDTGAVRIAADDGQEYLWRTGERAGWRPAADSITREEAGVRARLTESLQIEITALARNGSIWHAGASDGRIFTSTDSGETWRSSANAAGARVQRIFADSRDPFFAVAITASNQRARVLQTVTGGIVWDDVTGNLPPATLRGVTADRSSGAIYAASSAGVFLRFPDSPQWTPVRTAPAADVALDASGNQLYVAEFGAGVFGALAPHRVRDPRIVSAADRISRAAAPGSLLSVLGTRITEARVGELRAPVLNAADTESQIQVPFEINGTSLAVVMDSPTGRLQMGVPVRTTAPAIFVDPDGNPLLMNAENGLMLDAGTPARSGNRIQILATGLGRVTPNWPAGLPAPLQDPPRVVSPVRVYLDREPIEVTRATLAPGYIGMYLVEVQLPKIVNAGTSELYLEADSEQSNRVRLWLEP